jgi:transposase
MSDHHFWLTEDQLARLQPLLPNKPRGVPRVDDRRVISGIIHVIRGGLMWQDAPPVSSAGAGSASSTGYSPR